MIDRFHASLLCFAVGDALGAPIEDVIRNPEVGEEPVTDYTRAFPSHPVSHLIPGQYSDETQIMLVVTRSLVSVGGFSVEDLVNRFIDWYQSQKLRAEWRFPSNTMMKASRKLASGTPWTGSGFPSAGSIAAVRTLPMSLAFWRTPALLRDAVEKSCRITHTDPKVAAASMILATAIRMGLEGNDPSVETLINSAMERAQAYSPEVPRRLKLLREAIKLDPKPAMHIIGSGGMALETISAAIYWFFRFPKRFDEMIIGAANSGGDSDAIAALAGAVFGSFNGLSAISDRWFRKLENASAIKQAASDLYRISAPQK